MIGRTWWDDYPAVQDPRKVLVRLWKLAGQNWKALLGIVLILFIAYFAALSQFGPKYYLQSDLGWSPSRLTSWNLNVSYTNPQTSILSGNSSLQIQSASPVPMGGSFLARTMDTSNVDLQTYGFLLLTVKSAGPDVAILAWIWTSNEGSRNVLDSTFADNQPHTVLIDLHFAGVNGKMQSFGLGFKALASLSQCTVQFSGIQIENIGMVKS